MKGVNPVGVMTVVTLCSVVMAVPSVGKVTKQFGQVLAAFDGSVESRMQGLRDT